MLVPRTLSAPSWAARLGCAIVVLVVCVPLFWGLDTWDQRNDEAIYSYAVDEILATGDWLTPRSIFTDTPFLEKPPLKFWLVAGAMKLGLLPFNDWGMRFIDAMFSAVACLYVFGLGRRLGGPIAGVASAFVLFAFDPLLYWHGIRENQMESSLLLAYCGGMYHFIQWKEASARRPRLHAYAFAAYFFLAFMTKFVAAVFLPAVCAGVVILRPGGWIWWRSRWTEWVKPAVVTVAAIVPWFIYQLIHSGAAFVEIIFTQHIVVRFAGTLIASHLGPWHYYFTHTWLELGYAGLLVCVGLGVPALIFRAWARRDWVAQLMIAWWLVPMVFLSLGTSKLFYYAHPFFPPLALGAGLAAALLFQLIAEHGRSLIVRLGLKGLATDQELVRRSSTRGRILFVLGLVCFAVALWTTLYGPFKLRLGGMTVFQNGSVARPIVIAALFWHFAGFGSVLLKLVGLAALVALLPVSGYAHRIDRLSRIDHPIRTARDCALAVQARGAAAGKGVFDAEADIHHAYLYYLRRLGPWQEARGARPDELQRRLEGAGEQTLVLMSAEDYALLGGAITPAKTGGSREGPAPTGRPAQTAKLQRGLPPGITIGNVVVILFPGPFAECAAPVARAGAQELKPTPPRQ